MYAGPASGSCPRPVPRGQVRARGAPSLLCSCPGSAALGPGRGCGRGTALTQRSNGCQARRLAGTPEGPPPPAALATGCQLPCSGDCPGDGGSQQFCPGASDDAGTKVQPLLEEGVRFVLPRPCGQAETRPPPQALPCPARLPSLPLPGTELRPHNCPGTPVSGSISGDPPGQWASEPPGPWVRLPGDVRLHRGREVLLHLSRQARVG